MRELIIASSVLILVVIVLRHFLKGKISLRLQYALWALVLLRLLVPVSLFESPISVMNAVRSAEFARGTPAATAPVPPLSSANGNMETAGVAVADAVGQPASDTVTNETHHVFNWGLLAKWVWYAGIGFVGLTLLVSNLSFGRKLRKTGIRYPTDQCKLPVYLVEALPAPCLFGLFRPKIYITPDVAGNETKLRHVLAHEMTHYRHGDHIWSALRGLSLSLHWYNPLVWLAAALSRRDAELACDEGTIKRIGEESRMEYGRTLIGLTCEKCKPVDLLCCATTMTDGKKGIKERVTLIAKKPKMLLPALFALVLVAAVAVGCTFTGAKTDSEASAENEWDITLLGPDGENCPLRLGMSVAEATKNLEAAQIDLKGDYTDQLFNEDYSLWFTEATDEAERAEWILSSISVKTPVIETAAGLKNGDAEDHIEQIYGPCETVRRDLTEGHKYYYYEMGNYVLRISSGSGGVFSDPDDPYYVFSWTICAKEYSNSYFPGEVEGVACVEGDVLPVLLAGLPDDLIYLYGDKKDIDTTGAYDGMYLYIRGMSRYFEWQSIGKESFLPELILRDINDDGQKELIVILTTGEGTGVNQKAVHVINAETFVETSVRDPLTIISAQVSTSIDQDNGTTTLSIIVNGRRTVVVLSEHAAPEQSMDQAFFGSVVTYELDGTVLKATVPAQISDTLFAGDIVITYAFDANEYIMKTIDYVPYE